MTSAFATFANQGLRMKPMYVTRITDRDGQHDRGERARSPTTRSAPTPRYIMTSLLRGVAERGTAAKARALKRPIAGKTGTTNDCTDAWFVGYEPALAAGVWVGFDDKKRSASGAARTARRTALPIWMEFWQRR